MAELVFYHGTMNSGKSTLALQMNYNRYTQDLQGLIFTKNDRAGDDLLSSRLGISAEAQPFTDTTRFFQFVLNHETYLQYLIVDEAQFLTPEQVYDLAMVVDQIGTDVYCFGLLTDFKSRLFPGSQRLVELSDRLETLQSEALCWCGETASHNARLVDGVMVLQGEQVVVGDVTGEEVSYVVLCRRHYRNREPLEIW